VARPPLDGRPGGGRTTLWPNGVAGQPFLAFSSWGHFGNKNANWVKLPQFESLEGLSVTLETFEVKVKNRWILQGVKCNFSLKFKQKSPTSNFLSNVKYKICQTSSSNLKTQKANIIYFIKLFYFIAGRLEN
jgi:hypothetical protein